MNILHCNYAGFCDEPKNLTNGFKVSNGNSEGDTVTYFCFGGFNLSGNPIRICQADGNWSGTLPKCKRTFHAFMKYCRQIVLRNSVANSVTLIKSCAFHNYSLFYIYSNVYRLL